MIPRERPKPLRPRPSVPPDARAATDVASRSSPPARLDESLWPTDERDMTGSRRASGTPLSGTAPVSTVDGFSDAGPYQPSASRGEADAGGSAFVGSACVLEDDSDSLGARSEGADPPSAPGALHSTMISHETLPEAHAIVADAPSPRGDLTHLWEAAGRPRGRSPRSWRRTTLGRAAIARFAASRGVEPGGVFHDAGGPRAHVLADPAVAWLYAATLVPDDVETGLDELNIEDLADVRRLLADEARRKAEAESEREEYRVPLNAIDRVRAGVVDPWAGPDATPGDPRPRGAPPWGSPDHACSDCGSGESVFQTAKPGRWLCHVCRRC